jgi:hypothetical protein
MMYRRAFVASVVSLLTAPLAAAAQPTRKVYRIGYLANGSPTERAVCGRVSTRTTSVRMG